MSPQRTGLVVLAAGLALGGCAGMDGAPAEKRPPVQVQDTVKAIDQAMLVGSWQCKELNPLPGAPVVASTVNYLRDGSFKSEGRSAGSPPLGAVIVTATGKWRVEGERLGSSEVKSEARSADNNAATDALLAVGAGIANNIMSQQKPGSSDVLTLTRTSLVFRPLEVEDPPVISCTRA